MTGLLRIIEGGITAPEGFRAAGTICGLKTAAVKDLGVLLADLPCVAAGTFTTSRTKAAPVLVSLEKLQSGQAQGIIINSGNANCSTGRRGLADAQRMAELAGRHLKIDPKLMLVASTGIIGRPLDMEKIEAGIASLFPRLYGADDLAAAIMTTDTRPKMLAAECEIGTKMVRLAGVTKGSGMIYPHMATMICLLTTDANVEHSYLVNVLRRAVDDSFNMIAVDGDMSTNDTVVIFASGLAGNVLLRESSPEASVFEAALRQVTTHLAKEIARDGEGAKKLMTVTVRGAKSREDARKAARAVTTSRLWQCALSGGDPNWGRIMAALGASGAELVHELIDLYFGDVCVVKQGIAAGYQAVEAREAIAGQEVEISIEFHLGAFQATAWGCDLSEGYILENTLYHR